MVAEATPGRVRFRRDSSDQFELGLGASVWRGEAVRLGHGKVPECFCRRLDGVRPAPLVYRLSLLDFQRLWLGHEFRTGIVSSARW